LQRISSRSTFLYKRIFPLFFIGFLGLWAWGGYQGGMPLVFFIVPVFMGIFFYFLMKKLVFDLADEVLDAGDYLIVRFGSEQEQIPLSEIINVSYAHMMNPPRATLTLRTPGHFGKEISFSAPIRFLPFAKSPLLTELIERVDAARRR
jgi:hypothetical protein